MLEDEADNFIDDDFAPASGHVPVLPREVIEYLAIEPGQTVVDCTLGRAGHAQLIAEKLGPQGHYIGIDVDPANIENAQEVLNGSDAKVTLVHENFGNLPGVLDDLGINGVDGLLADLGFASTQISDASRGFSFMEEGPLDMRLDPRLPKSAADIVNDLPEQQLANLIYEYGEERLSRRIAKKIAEERAKSPIKTTTELAQLVRWAYGRQAGRSRINPATRTFQALRIAVNGELEALDRLLSSLPGVLAKRGRAVLISFHSLEDRRVKHCFSDLARDGVGKVVTRKPITADDQERLENPRSRSAKLRTFELSD